MEPDRKPAQLSSKNEASARISKATAALRRFVPEQAIAASITLPQIKSNVSTAHVSDLVTAFAAIASVQKVLARAESLDSAEVATALHEYKRLLKEFRANLPRIHGWLLAERARLASKRSHFAGVESWLRTSRQTRW